MFTDISSTIVIEQQSNISSITGSNGMYTISFSTPMNNVNYAPFISLGTGGDPLFVSYGFWTTRNLGSVVISIVDSGGELVSDVPYGATIMIMSI